jgi:uncharacterized membrane protein HdeD (DUF308 family)
MLDLLARNWWMLALRGVFAIIFGVLVILFPITALTTLIILFAIYSIADGVMAIWAVLSGETSTRKWAHLLEGVVSVIAGIIAVLLPGMTALVLLYVIAAWAIVTGALQIWNAIELRKEIEGEFWLGLSGLLSVIFGILLIVNPGTGILTVLLLVSAYSIVFGVMLLMLAFRLKGMNDRPQNRPISGTV